MWKSDSGGDNFASKIEDVWAILREGATSTSSRNSRKTFEDFYDTWMTVYYGSANNTKRQNFRNVCDTRGIVYSRMKLTDIKPISTATTYSAIADKIWVSEVSNFKAEQMDDSFSELNCSDVDEVVRKVKFDVSSMSSVSPFSWATSINDTDLVSGGFSGAGSWNNFANASSNPFEGELNASTAGLSNKYYIVRARVEEDGTASPETSVMDNLIGSLLDTTDTSNKTTAQWWNELGIVYQIKVDKNKPNVNNRFPPAN